MKIAIVGSGLAGLAAASFLKRDGHDVTVFERENELKGKGFGIQIQPLGVAALKQIGLADKLVAEGARVNRVLIEKVQKDRVIADMQYNELEPGLFAVGIHRPRLYDILIEKARELGVTFVKDCNIEDSVIKGQQRQLLGADGQDKGSFDLVVDASGYKSPLRQKYAKITRNKAYPYTVVCGTVEYDNKLSTAFNDAASYSYKEATHSMTLIPAGKDPATGKEQVSFFWMMPEKEFGTFKLDAWKKEATDIMPSLKPYLDQIAAPEQLVFVRYADVALKTYNTDRMVFVGDSAHATSPLLGQSTSMAFVDALVLAKVLQQPDLKKALDTYSAERKDHIKFQQDNSRLMTRIFQSVAPPVKFYRDFLLPKVIMKIPGMRLRSITQSARAESSLKNSPLRKKYGI